MVRFSQQQSPPLPLAYYLVSNSLCLSGLVSNSLHLYHLLYLIISSLNLYCLSCSVSNSLYFIMCSLVSHLYCHLYCLIGTVPVLPTHYITSILAPSYASIVARWEVVCHNPNTDRYHILLLVIRACVGVHGHRSGYNL